MPSLLIVSKYPPPGMREGDTLTNGTFPYKCKFPLQKENLYPVYIAFSESVPSRWPLAPNNSYARKLYFGVGYFDTPHHLILDLITKIN